MIKKKGNFEVYSSWQYKHHLLPDSLNKKVWFSRLNKEQVATANEKRKEWFANSISEIKTKSNFLNTSRLPFIFTSVRKSIGYLRDDFDKKTALEQYRMITAAKVEMQKNMPKSK